MLTSMREPKALTDSNRFRVRRVTFSQPFEWLGAGWRDFMACPFPGLLHGAAVAVFGSLMFWTARHYFWLLAGAFSGFLLVAPVLATGLYAISRALEAGPGASLGVVARAWRSGDRRMVRFGLLLALAGTGWVGTSAAFITAMVPSAVRDPQDFLQLVVLANRGLVFELWLALGGVLAAPVFASSVVALPLLMDRDASVLGAVLTSWRCVLVNPGPVAIWAAVLMALSLLGMATAMLGLLVIVPWLGHASWHAYRGLVGVDDPGKQAS